MSLSESENRKTWCGWALTVTELSDKQQFIVNQLITASQVAKYHLQASKFIKLRHKHVPVVDSVVVSREGTRSWCVQGAVCNTVR